MVGQPAPREWPCQVCNLPGHTVPNRGDACERCQRRVAEFVGPDLPAPTIHEILPPRYRDGRPGGRKETHHGLETRPNPVDRWAA